MRVLIAGCGYVGIELGLRLTGSGHEVWGVRRDPSRLPAAIRPVAADLLAPGLEDRLPDVDHVVYAASADASAPEAYRSAYGDGVERLLSALSRTSADVRRFLFVSSTAVYGDAAGGWVDETTAPEPANFRGEEVVRGEGRVLNGPFPAVILRLGGIYGPGRTRLLERVRSGEARCPEGEGRWTNRIHRDDAAGAIEHLLALESPDELYVGVDEEPARLCEVYREVARMLGVAPPPEGPVDDRGRGGDRRCSSARLRASGYRFRYPTFREGYRAMIEAA